MSGLIPQAFIDDLLTRCDLVELIDSYTPLKKRGNSYIACCPFHNEKTPSFNVISKKKFYHCFGCGVSGNAISFIMQYLNQNFVEAVETLASRLGMQVPTEKKSDANGERLSLYQTLEKVNQFYQQTLKDNTTAIDYLKKRGLNGVIAKAYQLGYAEEGWHVLEHQFKAHQKELIASGMLIEKEHGSYYDRYRNRIMFPIHDRRGRIIGFGGRALLPDQQPKYLNSPETAIFQKNRELYGLYQVLQSNKTPEFIVVVEGYLDVIALAQHGIKQVVAALGTAISTYHIELLRKHTRKIVFCFDGDKAGHEAAWRALENSLPLLHDDLEVNFVFLPDGEDPDSFVRTHDSQQFLTKIQQATPLSEFFLMHLSDGINLQQIAGKNQFIQAVKPYLQRLPNGPFHQLLLNELSRLTHIENHRLEAITKTTQEPQKNDQPAFITPPHHRSPARLMMAILLQNPQLFSMSQDIIETIELGGEEQEILQQLTEKIKQAHTPSTAVLIEAWRDHVLFDTIKTLAFWEHNIPEDKLQKEFVDILYFLKKQHLEKKINQYIAKSRKQGLTESERIYLQNLLKERHLSIAAGPK